jgi:hypothetical protein
MDRHNLFKGKAYLMIMTRGRHERQMPPKIQMKIEEKNVCKFRSTCILNTFSIDENFIKKYKKKILKKGGGVLVMNLRK